MCTFSTPALAASLANAPLGGLSVATHLRQGLDEASAEQSSRCGPIVAASVPSSPVLGRNEWPLLYACIATCAPTQSKHSKCTEAAAEAPSVKRRVWCPKASHCRSCFMSHVHAELCGGLPDTTWTGGVTAQPSTAWASTDDRSPLHRYMHAIHIPLHQYMHSE